MKDQINSSSFPKAFGSKRKSQRSPLEDELAKRAVKAKSSIPKLDTPMPRLRPPVLRHDYGRPSQRFFKKV